MMLIQGFGTRVRRRYLPSKQHKRLIRRSEVVVVPGVLIDLDGGAPLTRTSSGQRLSNASRMGFPQRRQSLMSDEIFDTEKLIPVLNEIMKAELAGVVRYTHYALVITGPNRLPLVDFMKTQASESLLHAQMVGELVTGLGGHPDQGIAHIEESHDHSLETVLRESIAHERRALDLYRQMLEIAEGDSVYLEEFARTQIGEEELHVIELNKLLRDYTIS